MKALSRLDMSPLSRWFWSVDRLGLAIVAIIAALGVTLLFAAGPSASLQYKIDDRFHYPLRQILFLAPAFLVMIGVSMLSPLQARRLGVLLFALALAAMAATVTFGAEINGARRWLSLGPISFQPSEFAKPGFVVFAAWFLAEARRTPGFPGAPIAFGLYLLFIVLLVNEPDYGQAALVTMVWATMLFVAGGAWIWMGGLVGVGAAALAFGYMFSPHIAKRVSAFLDPESGADTFQVDRALQAIREGGAFGSLADGADVKYKLPDAHTDFIFSVAGEEHGFILCAVIIALYGALVLHFLRRAGSMRSLFQQCAITGLTALFGLQAFINMAVNLRLMPAKGMTLPFISYGGSSLLAMGLVFGLILAFSRSPGRAFRRKEIMP
ncbi:MAG: putative lipid II flippase FtsW [Parvularculaceae bacterium]|nr:putative lipid II flippase FtsW [Parvularculaceae bacterium]